MTCILGVVKCAGALNCSFFLVDVIGLKRSLGIGITFLTVSMAYVAIFLNIVGTPDPSSFTPSQVSSSISAIVMIYLCSFEWALGWNGIQYLINAEIYSLHIHCITHHDASFCQTIRCEPGSASDATAIVPRRNGFGRRILVLCCRVGRQCALGLVIHSRNVGAQFRIHGSFVYAALVSDWQIWTE